MNNTKITDANENKKKKKTAEKKNSSDRDDDISTEMKINNKEEKKKKNSCEFTTDTDNDSEENIHKEKKKSKKKDRKRKASELNGETRSEIGEPVNLKDKKKKRKLIESDDQGGAEKEEKEELVNGNAVSNFRICQALRNVLKSKGIESLFPIQAITFDTILDGADLVGRARTGQVHTFYAYHYYNCFLLL